MKNCVPPNYYVDIFLRLRLPSTAFPHSQLLTKPLAVFKTLSTVFLFTATFVYHLSASSTIEKYFTSLEIKIVFFTDDTFTDKHSADKSF